MALNDLKFDGVNIQKSLEKTANVMNRLFVAPRPELLLLPILLLSIITGFLLRFNSNDLYTNILIDGIFLLAIPTYLSALLSKYLTELLGGIFYLRRSMLLSFICLGCICLILLLGKFTLIPFFSISLTSLFIISYATIFWIRHVVFLSIALSSHHKAILPSLIQPFIGLLFVYYLYPFQQNEWLLLIASFIIFFSSVYLYILLVNAPMKKNFGVNGLVLLKYFFIHMTEHKEISEIDNFFKSFSERLDILVSVIGFKTKQHMKALIVVPFIHPGPFGNLGGGNLPSKLADGLQNISPNVFVPHSATNHDYNLAVSKDYKKVVDEVKHLINSMNFSSGGTPLIRCHDKLDICAQRLGNSLLLVHTSAPNPTDDIDPSIGQLIINDISNEVVPEVVFVDAHNCLERGAGCVFFNTPKAHKMVELSKKSADLVLNKKTSQMKIGIAQQTGFSVKDDGIGSQGIQVLTVDVGGKKNSYILFDGNNMVKGLREKIIAGISDLVDDIEILTTDNHIVNVKIGGYNPIGLKINQESLIQKTTDLIRKSIDDLEECNVGVNSGLVKDIRLFGYGNTYRISTTINSILSTLRIHTVLTLLLAFLLCLFSYIIIF